jgi:hypothetical protein
VSKRRRKIGGQWIPHQVAMIKISREARCNSALTSSSTGSCPDEWREYWRVHGTKWRSVIELHLEICDRLWASSSWASVTICPTCDRDHPCPSPSFCAACRDADRRKARGESPRFIDPVLWRTPDVVPGWEMMSPDRLWNEINHAARERYNGAPESTFNACVYELRTHGLAQLAKPDCQRQLSDLSAAQVKAVIASLHRKRGEYPKVTDELLTALAAIYEAKGNGK